MPPVPMDNKNVGNKNEAMEVEKTDCHKRLDFLLAQSELFSHFMMNGTKKSSCNESRQRRTNLARRDRQNTVDSRNYRNHRRKKQEDEILADTIANQDVVTQFDSSPFYIENGQMRDYQIRGLNWMISLFENGINGILADEMGLGKTLQTISLLGYLKNYRQICGPHLIIVPKSTIQAWMKEFSTFCPSLKVMRLIGSKLERAELINKEFLSRKWDVCIVSYEVVLLEKSVLRKVKWRYLIIDEAHRIKNEKSKLAGIVRKFETTNRLLLTGTPLQNNLHELWSLLNFLLPDFFNSSEDFDNWFDIKSCMDVSLVERLHAILKPFLLRRVKSDVEKSLLPKKEVKVYVGLTQMQREQYKKILMKDIDILNCVGWKTKMPLLNLLMQLRKCTNHPYLFYGTEPGPPYINDEHLIFNCGKMILLDKLLQRSKEQGSKVLLFCQMTRMMNIIEDYFILKGFQYCRLDGNTALEDRQSQIDEFNAPSSQKFIFIISTRAGGLGISLPSADVVIIYDTDWNPQVDLQAIDRAHRIGQKKQVKVFRLITENTIEEKIVEKAEVKLRLDRLVIQQGRLVDNQKINKEELFNIVRFGAEHVLASKDSEITDEDIDTILQKGENKTKRLNKKLENMGGSLQDFTLEIPTISCYDFEGKDYKEENRLSSSNVWIELPKRERKISYVKFFQNRKKPHCPSIPKIYDFQFFPQRLSEILKKEQFYYWKSIGYEIDIGEKVEQFEIDLAQPLTESEVTEKQELLTKGFFNWNKDDFNHFIEAVENYGPEDIVNICQNVEGKTPEEVREYHNVFWKRHKELKGNSRILQRINQKRAVRELQNARAIQNAWNAKMTQYQNPFTQIEIKHEKPYASNELNWYYAEQTKNKKELVEVSVKAKPEIVDLSDSDSENYEKQNKKAKTIAEKNELLLKEMRLGIFNEEYKENIVQNSSLCQCPIIKETKNAKIDFVHDKRQFEEHENEEMKKLKKKFCLTDIRIELPRISFPEEFIGRHFETEAEN